MSEFHMEAPDASRITMEGTHKSSASQSRSRVFLSIMVMGLAYLVIVGRLTYLGFQEPGSVAHRVAPDVSITAVRPDIRDRNT